MDDQWTITGRTVFTRTDQFRAVHWRLYLYRLAGVIFLLPLALGLLWVSGQEIALGWQEALIMAPILLLAGLVPFVLHARQFSRLGDEIKQLRYLVDSESIVTRDATDASTSLPWSVVRRCIEKEWGFLLVTRPEGRRWLLKRAFKREDLDALRRLIKAKLGGAARVQEPFER
jgi:hypothetical protein